MRIEGNSAQPKCIQRQIAIDHEMKSTDFPVISTGVYGYPIDQAVALAVNTILNYTSGKVPDDFIEKQDLGRKLMDNTLEYYNKNADQFIRSTLSVDFKQTQDRFLAKLSAGAYILDFGCGSGRDTRYFLEKGYQVDAADGSEELCKIASDYTGIKVQQMLFEELCDVDKYDGIWACSSILHLSKISLTGVLKKMAAALKDSGVIYTSFKYGDFEGERNGRYFTDFTIEAFKEYIQEIPELQIEEYWITADVRPGRGEEKWLNLILRQSDIH